VVSYLIMTDEAVQQFPGMQFYIGKGFTKSFVGVDTLAEVSVPPSSSSRPVPFLCASYIRIVAPH
jgi:hypothetical protein